MLKVKLNRDLRKNILRGHPWVYREAIQAPSVDSEACLCQVLDKKGGELAWALYSPQGPLALRILSTEKKPPNQRFFSEQLLTALRFRKQRIPKNTSAYRLVNGEGDGLPGLVCDIYNDLAVIQFDGESCFQFWDEEWVAGWLLESNLVKSVYLKPRKSDSWSGHLWGEQRDLKAVRFHENGIHFLSNIEDGQKTGFFLDQRHNRQYISEISRSLKVLNLFSYTGGFSLYAAHGGADQVTSVDISQGALDMAGRSWALNDFGSCPHQTESADVFEYLNQLNKQWEMVIVDPPSMTHSEEQKPQAMKSYVDLFQQASRTVVKKGHLVLSSCSSHISFDDFFEIINESLSQGRRKGRIHRVSGQGADHPFPHYCHELRYLKFVHLVLD